MYQLKENQYIPYRAKRTPNGMPMCSTYYYIVNSDGKVVDKDTLKPYMGKDMARYAMHSKSDATNYINTINN